MLDGGNIVIPATPEETVNAAALMRLAVKTARRMTAEQRKQISDYPAKQKYH
jgi:hypothetical protein